MYEFSVLMSVYAGDDPKYFRMALESVSVNQTLHPNQIVIVLDGLVPEDFRSIIEMIQRETPCIAYKVIAKKKNAGLAAALNSGLPHCAYKWIARMDADDISVPNRFERQIAFLRSHPEVQVLGGYIAEFEQCPMDYDKVRKVGITHGEIREMLKSRSPMNHMTVIFSKEAVEKVGGYSEGFGKLEDYKLWVDMLSAGACFANIPSVLVYARAGEGFIERRSSKREIIDWDMLQEYLLKAELITKWKALLNKLCIRGFIYMPTKIKAFMYYKILREKKDGKI